MPDIRLFVCSHRKCEVPNHELLYPLQVGAALSGHRIDGFFSDHTGEQISEKNRSYCELTGQFWAWKNVQADYFGFFHYRRYLYPCANALRPYRIAFRPKGSLLKRLGYGNFARFIEQYDLIVPLGENMHLPVREHYARAPHHHREDLELVEQIVCEQSPEMAPAMERYFSGTICYFGNIYIMNSAVFHRYCTWLFSILEEFDRRCDTAGYSEQELRVNGYLAERLFGVFYEYTKDSLRTAELPRVLFHPGWDGVKRAAVNLLLPPGSKVRASAKKLLVGQLGKARG